YVPASFENRIKQLMPRNDIGDWAVALVSFYRCHKRLPKRRHGGFNDALFWLKASGQLKDSLRVRTTDKVLVKGYVKKRVGDKYNVPTLSVLKTIQETQSFPYPANCAIKPTHMSGKVILRTNGAPIDYAEIENWFSTNYYHQCWGWREQNYKTLSPKVIVEPLIFGREVVEDYKVFCVWGAAKAIQVDLDRHTKHTRCLYTPNWTLLPYGLCYPVGQGIQRPRNLDEMLAVAARLAEPFSLVRVDLYTDGETVYVGELTHCHGNAQEHVQPAEKEAEFAELLFGPDGFDRKCLARC
ncbi:MAG: ATP-grasp fold amidoligase family protein, partial [Candidatus Acidiferrum sp.]